MFKTNTILIANIINSLKEKEDNSYKGSNKGTNILNIAVVIAIAIIIIVIKKGPYRKRNILFIRKRNAN